MAGTAAAAAQTVCECGPCGCAGPSIFCPSNPLTPPSHSPSHNSICLAFPRFPSLSLTLSLTLSLPPLCGPQSFPLTSSILLSISSSLSLSPSPSSPFSPSPSPSPLRSLFLALFLALPPSPDHIKKPSPAPLSLPLSITLSHARMHRLRRARAWPGPPPGGQGGAPEASAGGMGANGRLRWLCRQYQNVILAAAQKLR